MKPVFAFLLAVILLIVHLSPTWAQTSGGDNFPRLLSLWPGWKDTLGAAFYAGFNTVIFFPFDTTAQTRAKAIRSQNSQTKILFTSDATYSYPYTNYPLYSLINEWLNSTPGSAGYPCLIRDTQGTILKNGTYGHAMFNMTNTYCVDRIVQANLNVWNSTNNAFDGMYWDVVYDKISHYGATIDADLNGIADDPAVLNENYKNGVIHFLSDIRVLLPDKIFVANDSPTTYSPWLNGRALESDLTYYLDGRNYQTWDEINAYYQKWTNTGVSPRRTFAITGVHSDLMNKFTPSTIFNQLNAAMDAEYAASYQRMRFGLASVLMGDGYYIFDLGPYRYGLNWWYDEYGTTGNSPVNNGLSPGYLGQPLGAMTNVSLSQDQIVNGNFSAGTQSWNLEKSSTAINGVLTSDNLAGVASVPTAHLAIAAGNPPGDGNNWMLISQLDKSLIQNQTYALTFWAKANSTRNLGFRLQRQVSPWDYASTTSSVTLSSTWSQYQVVLTATKTLTDAKLVIDPGTAAGQVYFDDVAFQSGQAGVFQRDFQKGLVLLNTTASVQTVNLSQNYQKINGSQAPLWSHRLDDEQAIYSGTWSTLNATLDQFGYNVHTSTGPNSAATATYTPPILSTGQYQLFAWVVPKTGQSASATVTIRHTAGNSTVTLNLSSGAIGWRALGTYNCSSSLPCGVTLAATGTGIVVADAFKWDSVARYNDGSVVNSVTLQPNDAIILLKITSSPNLMDLDLDNDVDFVDLSLFLPFFNLDKPERNLTNSSLIDLYDFNYFINHL